MENLHFTSFNPNDFKKEIANEIKTHLDEFLKNYKPIQPKEYLTRQNVAEMFSVNLSTLHNWNRTGKLKPLGISGRVYYLRSQVEEALIPLNQ